MGAQHKVTGTSKEHNFISLEVKFLDYKSSFIKNKDVHRDIAKIKR